MIKRQRSPVIGLSNFELMTLLILKPEKPLHQLSYYTWPVLAHLVP